jgi:hypothetical protein
MPEGFDQTDEAELHKAERLLDRGAQREMKKWWFKIVSGRQTGPSFDIASTFKFRAKGIDKTGLLLVEAKAHDKELRKEEGGKRLPKEPTANECTNDKHIRDAIKGANAPLEGGTGVRWALSADSRYQMSNRFASAAKLTELGFPVVLVYLGLLNAGEMRTDGELITSPEAWTRLVLAHSAVLFPPSVWGRAHTVYGQPLVPLIRSVELPFDSPVTEFIVRDQD